MVKPGGTGNPALVISARPAPLPPRSSFILPLPSAFPPPKEYTYLVALLAAFFEGDSVSGIVSVAMNAFVLFYEVFDSAFPKFCHSDRRRSFARERSSEWRNLLPSSAQNVPSLQDFDHLLAHPALTRW